MDVNEVRKDFTILQRKIRGKNLVYLDSAATSHKPVHVMNAMSQFANIHNSNIHRANHTIAGEATDIYEGAREEVRRFINAPRSYDIVFTKNCTEAINIVANGIESHEGKDEYASTIVEHHANFVPWQQNAILNNKKFIVISDYSDPVEITNRTAIVASSMASNVTGEMLDYHSIIRKARSSGAITLIDAAQAAPHMMLDVNDSNADFYAFSAHKMLGPTGLGILVGKKKLLDTIKPLMYGGDMVREVYPDRTVFQQSPHRLEAGTMPLMEVAGLREAISYLNGIGKAKVRGHSEKLSKLISDYTAESERKGATRITYAKNGMGLPIVSLHHPNVHHNDIGLMLDSEGIAVRTGHHCAMPFMASKKIEGTLRASAYIYTTEEEIGVFFDSYNNAISKMG
jgi:cysteine desulfurase / selenocysteine lyase